MSARLMSLDEVPEEFWCDLFDFWNLPETAWIEVDRDELQEEVTEPKVAPRET